ncbi:DUF4023 domain-containing protein [Paenibacillus soyae]|uniref:DUF4023 domain-containing protein n=1 Tax=Paenibacillus soyae TaxID=2969249 RepID=A0A9X2MRU8_9BACL|nr:DUF4023 domain-containing protein [Paenibacillus soyae]MCR2805215.1 DUF4023 domain-containing protein [Paenibacillus soyae]
MDSTNEFVNKVHDTQQKAEKNKRNRGNGVPSAKMAHKQHSTNK